MSKNERKFIALREWAATVKAGTYYLADVVKNLNEDLKAGEKFDTTDVKPEGDDGA